MSTNIPIPPFPNQSSGGAGNEPSCYWREGRKMSLCGSHTAATYTLLLPYIMYNDLIFIKLNFNGAFTS